MYLEDFGQKCPCLVAFASSKEHCILYTTVVILLHKKIRKILDRGGLIS